MTRDELERRMNEAGTAEMKALKDVLNGLARRPFGRPALCSLSLMYHLR